MNTLMTYSEVEKYFGKKDPMLAGKKIPIHVLYKKTDGPKISDYERESNLKILDAFSGRDVKSADANSSRKAYFDNIVYSYMQK